MKLINIVEIEVENRYVPIEIYQGDITKIGFQIDLIITSSFVDEYSPTKNTVLGALYENLSIDLNKLIPSKNSVDLRKALNCIFSEIEQPNEFKGILNIELKEITSYNDKELDLKNIFKKMFIALNVLDGIGYTIKSIALPVLGAGLQNINYDIIITFLLEEVKNHLQKNHQLERILFVEYNGEKAARLSESLDTVLKRVKVDLPLDELITTVKKDIITLIKKNNTSDLRSSQSFKFLKRTFKNEDARSVEYGIACRKITEKILAEKYSSDTKKIKLNLYSQINQLHGLNVSNWIISYLHVIRIFGNEAAHDINIGSRNPKIINTKDISLLLFCVLRIVEFWSKDN